MYNRLFATASEVLNSFDMCFCGVMLQFLPDKDRVYITPRAAFDDANGMNVLDCRMALPSRLAKGETKGFRYVLPMPLPYKGRLMVLLQEFSSSTVSSLREKVGNTLPGVLAYAGLRHMRFKTATPCKQTPQPMSGNPDFLVDIVIAKEEADLQKLACISEWRKIYRARGFVWDEDQIDPEQGLSQDILDAMQTFPKPRYATESMQNGAAFYTDPVQSPEEPPAAVSRPFWQRLRLALRVLYGNT